MKNTAPVVAAVLMVWLATALVRIENERYALFIGMCWNKTLGVADPACLQKVETRTDWWGYVFYARTD